MKTFMWFVLFLQQLTFDLHIKSNFHDPSPITDNKFDQT